MGKGRGKGRGMPSCDEIYRDWVSGDDPILGSPPAWFMYCIFVLGAFVMAIVLWACSVKTVKTMWVALPYDTVWCKLEDRVLEEGMHGLKPFGEIIEWPSTYKRLEQCMSANTLDGVPITVCVAFMFKPSKNHLYDLTKTYKDWDGYLKVLKWRSRSAIRHACSEFETKDFQTSRATVQARMEKKLGEEVSPATERPFKPSMHAEIMTLNFISHDQPAVYVDAITLTEDARNDIALAETQRAMLMTEAQTKLLEARQAANTTLMAASREASVIAAYAASDAAKERERYAYLATLYADVKQTHAISTETLLSYIGRRLVSEAPNVALSMDAPAKMAWKTSLT